MKTPIYKQISMKNSLVNTVLIPTAKANLIIVSAAQGFLMCGYLNIDVAEKLGDAACIVSGVSTVEQLLAKPVVKLTKQAEQLGICLGDTGQQALEKML
ncbi:MAG: DUF1805 domain-containing protein [Candidatus Omnitrophica bacterium]|nr:DUF1805 domain-containing protein [Candidatus Omnitrophota bacterium]